jgi:hypothetical protein
MKIGLSLVVALCCSAAHAATPVMQRGLFRGQPVTYTIVHGQKIFQGDMVLDHVTAFPSPRSGLGQGAGPGQPAVGVAYPQYLWRANAQGVAEIPYIVTSAATELNNALSAFNASFTGVIQFVPRNGQADYVNFDFDASNLSGQCESNVGHIGGEQQTGGSAACSIGTLLHEMGHIVGLYHEMSRPDRNTYITVNDANIIKGSEANFAILGDNFQDLTLFDYASVMEYIPFAFTRNGGAVVESIPPGIPLSSQASYSAGDIDGIERLYGFIPTAVTTASNPPGLSVIVDGATITTPQSFAWKLKSTHTLAVPANAQTLNGVTYTYGRWNDNIASSHSIVAAPGNNTLAQPATSPAVTVYTANFVQLAAYSSAAVPPAAGSLSVSPAPLSYPGATGSFFVARQAVTLTPVPAGSYQFLTWSGTSAPFSANPKPDIVPDTGAPYAVTAYFSDQPITTITTNPTGLYFTVDGYYYQGPQSFASDVFASWTAGSTHTLTGFSPNQPYSVNTRYLFEKWSDNGALSHTITVRKAGGTLTGTWQPQYVPIATATPDCAATVTLTPASSDGFYNKNTRVVVAADSAAGWTLTGWTGDLAGKKPSQTLDVTDEELATAIYNTSATPLSLTSLTPDLYKAGTSGGSVKIHGKGFTSGSIVFVNNTYRPSTYVSAAEIEVPITSADLAEPGAFAVGVSNFPSGAPCSSYAALTFFVAR